jgi:hypothetical protein
MKTIRFTPIVAALFMVFMWSCENPTAFQEASVDNTQSKILNSKTSEFGTPVKISTLNITDLNSLNAVLSRRGGGNGHGGGSGEGLGRGNGNGNGSGSGHGNGNGSGSGSGGDKKGDTFGDMYILERDLNGVPVLSEEGFYQPIDINGDPIPLDEEGHPLDETAVIEVELGRTNVIRSPERTLQRGLDEVISQLGQAEAVKSDVAGRLVMTINGEDKTIDSPIENLAVYKELVNNGSLPIMPKSGAEVELALQSMFDGDDTPNEADFSVAKSFFAGATDKSIPLTIDKIVYSHIIMGIEGTIEQKDIEYINFLGMPFSYNREAAYGEKYVDILYQTGPDTYERRTVNIFSYLFKSEVYNQDGGIAVYTQAAEDARQVINFIHDYEIPEF